MKDAPAASRQRRLFPRDLAQCMEKLTRPIFKPYGLAGTRLASDWHDIVGSHLARHCIPFKLSFPRGGKTDGTLTVHAASGFALELQHLEPVILERIATYFGYKAVARLAIKQAWITAREETPSSSVTKKTTPVCVNPQLLKAVEEVEDPALRAALHSFARAVAAQHKP